MLPLFECIKWSSSLYMEEVKLFAIVNWTFHASDFLRLFTMSFKYGIILLRYSLTDRFFISSTVTFVFNIVVTPTFTYSC